MAGHLYFNQLKVPRSTFEQNVKKMASTLHSLGVREDSCVAILMRNEPRYFEIIEACRYLGAYFVPLNWHGTGAELEHIIKDAKAKLLLAHSDLLVSFLSSGKLDIPQCYIPTPQIVQTAYSIDAAMGAECLVHSDLIQNFEALYQMALPISGAPLKFRGMQAYTSGSTGRPKGIKRVQDEQKPDTYLVYKALAVSLMQLAENDRFYVCAPVYHSAPNTLTLCALAAETTDVYISSKFEAESFLADIQNDAVTHIYIVPTMMVRLLKLPKSVRQKYDVSSLKFAISTGSQCPPQVKQAMIDWFGPIFYESYGASEIGFMTLISSAEALVKPGSVGKVLPGGSIKILGQDKQTLNANESGLIYINLPQFGEFSYTNAEGDFNEIYSEGYTTVGDIGYLDEEGYLYINDRQKDMVISGGANIFPAEIEAQLIEIHNIVDCAVFGVPDPEFGEMLVAAVVCKGPESLTLQQIHEFLAQKLAKFKFPQKLELHTQLPREDSGKIFKQRLKQAYQHKSQ